MVPGDMYEWSRVIFAKKSKFHDAGGPDTVVSPCRHGYRRGDVAPLTWGAVIEPKIEVKMSEWLGCQAAVAAV